MMTDKEKLFNSIQELIDYHDAYILEGGDLRPMEFTYVWLPAQAPIWDYVNNQEAEMIMNMTAASREKGE